MAAREKKEQAHERKPGWSEQWLTHPKAISMGDPFDMTRQCGWKGPKDGIKEPHDRRKGDARKAQSLSIENPEERPHDPSWSASAGQSPTSQLVEHAHNNTTFRPISHSADFTGPGGHLAPAGQGFQFPFLNEYSYIQSGTHVIDPKVFLIPGIVLIIAALALAGWAKRRHNRTNRPFRRPLKRSQADRDEE